MNRAFSKARQRPALPMQRGATTMVFWRWAAPVMALAVLVLLSWKGYDWLLAHVGARGAPQNVAAGASGTVNHIDGNEVTARFAPPARAPSVSREAVFTTDDPGLQRAICAYLSAESARLSYEFEQPLPPPVLDRISTLRAQRRLQAMANQCAPAAPVKAMEKPAAPPTRPKH